MGDSRGEVVPYQGEVEEAHRRPILAAVVEGSNSSLAQVVDGDCFDKEDELKVLL